MEIKSILPIFTSISLDEIGKVSLMNRVDTKFVFSENQLPELLQLASTNYYILEVNGQRLSSYDTLYYDTNDLEMYIMHHNERAVRRKVRVRTYQESGETFLEIKRKNNHGRTKKKRRQIENTLKISDEIGNFVLQKSGFQWSKLHPALQVSFQRITLVDKQLRERLTIDTNLAYHNPRTQRNESLKGLVILELKREMAANTSPIQRILLDLSIHPRKMSKYCIGTALTNPAIKQNRFKQKICKIKKIIQQTQPNSTL